MAESTCIVDGCTKPRRYAAGWCPMHYQRMKTHASTDPRPKPPRAACECGKPVRCKGLCAACYRRSIYLRDKVAENATSRTYYLANREQRLAYSRAWYWSNREKAHARYLASKRKIAERRRELMQDPARRERIRHKAREWRKANPERWALRNRENQRRRRRGSEPVDYVAILAEHGMFCHICSMVIVDLTDLHFDHVIPLALGGPHSPDNIKPAHAVCNMRKGARVA